MGSISNRGFASMDPELRSRYASLGGQRSRGNFANDTERARTAGRLGAANQPLAAKIRGGRNSRRYQR